MGLSVHNWGISRKKITGLWTEDVDLTDFTQGDDGMVGFLALLT